jgi:hypothetical protein
MGTVIDKDMLKEALRELIEQEPSTFKNMLKEIMNEEAQLSENELDVKSALLLQKNFNRYAATFKALA